VKYTTALLQLLMLTLVIPMFSTPLQGQSVPRNLFGIELLGRGALYSVNYERLLTDRIGAGGGIAVHRVSGAGLFEASQRTTTLVMPTYVSWTPVGRTDSPYLSAGVTLSLSHTDEFLLGNKRFGSGAFRDAHGGLSISVGERNRSANCQRDSRWWWAPLVARYHARSHLL